MHDNILVNVFLILVPWNVMKVGFYCDDHTTEWVAVSDFEDCKKYCQNHGATILTYRDDIQRCVCCADSTSFVEYDNGEANVYKFTGIGNNLLYSW